MDDKLEKVVKYRLLQICVMEIWRECECGYFHFYNATRLMEDVLKDHKKTLGSSETYTLGAASILVSFVHLHGMIPATDILSYVLVCLLQRIPGDKNVTLESITTKFNQINKYYLCSQMTAKKLYEHNTRSRLFLEMLDFIEGNRRVPPPGISPVHERCQLRQLIEVGKMIDWKALDAEVHSIMHRWSANGLKEKDVLLLQQAVKMHTKGCLCTSEEITMNLIRLVLTFRCISEVPLVEPDVDLCTRGLYPFLTPPSIDRGVDKITMAHYWKS